jgi:hypothetical protein
LPEVSLKRISGFKISIENIMVMVTLIFKELDLQDRIRAGRRVRGLHAKAEFQGGFEGNPGER